jgi:hypothetical protein
LLSGILGISAVLLWLIGANLVLSRHFRKRGKSLLAEFEPFRFPWRELEPKEQRTILILGIVAFLMIMVAVAL